MSLEGSHVEVTVMIDIEYDENFNKIQALANKYISIHSSKFEIQKEYNNPFSYYHWIGNQSYHDPDRKPNLVFEKLNQELIFKIIGTKLGNQGTLFLLAELAHPSIDNRLVALDPEIINKEGIIVNSPRFAMIDSE